MFDKLASCRRLVKNRQAEAYRTQLSLRHALLEIKFPKTCRDPEGKPLQRGRFQFSKVA